MTATEPAQRRARYRNRVGVGLYSAYRDLQKAIEMLNRDGKVHPDTFETAATSIARASAAAGALWALTEEAE